METHVIVLAIVGMTFGGLGFLGSVGGILYVVFFRGKGNWTLALQSAPATITNSHSGAGPA